MKHIELSQGQVAIVDDEDFERLSQYNWYASKTRNVHTKFYAHSTFKRKKMLMHRFIVGFPIGMDVDHINHDGLDNRKENLRTTTRSQNMQNRKKNTGKCSSKYKGVSYIKVAKAWHVIIRINKESKNVGYFQSETSAAMAYDVAARDVYGEFAVLNFPSAHHG